MSYGQQPYEDWDNQTVSKDVDMWGHVGKCGEMWGHVGYMYTYSEYMYMCVLHIHICT